MKFLFVFAFILSGFGYAQQLNIASYSPGKSNQNSPESGIFELQIPKHLDKKTLEEKAVFYKDYFSVEARPEKQYIKIKMIDNTSGNRRVIKRYLITLGIKQIEVNKQLLSVDQFYEQQLK